MILVRLDDAAHLLNRSARTLRRWVALGLINPHSYDTQDRALYEWPAILDVEKRMRRTATGEEDRRVTRHQERA